MLSDNSFQTVGNVIRTFKQTFNVLIMLRVNPFQLLLNIIESLFLKNSFKLCMLSKNVFHTFSVLSEYLSEQCLMPSDNSFPKTLRIIRKVENPLHNSITIHKSQFHHIKHSKQFLM